MSIADKLQQIRSIKDSIRTSILDQGGSMDSVSSFNDYPSAINSIPFNPDPSGTLVIDQDGIYDVSQYETASVQVPSIPLVKVTIILSYDSTASQATSTYFKETCTTVPYMSEIGKGIDFIVQGNNLKDPMFGDTMEIGYYLSKGAKFEVQAPANSIIYWIGNNMRFDYQIPGGKVINYRTRLWSVNGSEALDGCGVLSVGAEDCTFEIKLLDFATHNDRL